MSANKVPYWLGFCGKWLTRNRHEGYAVTHGHPVTVDPEILGGTPVFKGTRVPIKTLFESAHERPSLLSRLWRRLRP